MSDLRVFNQTITNVKTQEYLKSVLGEKKDAFVNNMTALVANNKMLQDCEPLTLMYAGMKATALGLPLDQNLGFAYVLPYKNTKENKVEAQLQFGYKAYLQFAARGGECERINVTDVKEGELKARNRRTGDITLEFIADDAARAKAKTIGYLGYVRLRNGYEKEVYWSVEELTQHGLNYSQTFKKGYGVWKDNFDAMAKKTVLKLMLNKGDIPMSVEMAQLARYDQSVILDETGNARYIDNEKRSADEQAADFVEGAQEKQEPEDIQEAEEVK